MRRFVALLVALVCWMTVVSAVFPESSSDTASSQAATRLAEHESMPFQTTDEDSDSPRGGSTTTSKTATTSKKSGAASKQRASATQTAKRPSPKSNEPAVADDAEPDSAVDFVSDTVFVVGEVSRRGAFPYDERLTPQDYLMLAGLDRVDFDATAVQLLRVDGSMSLVDDETVMERGDTLIVLSQDEMVPETPTVREKPSRVGARREPRRDAAELEPPRTPDDQRRVRVAGAVAQPSRFAYDPRWSLSDYIAKAGALETADLDGVRVYRANGQLRDALRVSQTLPGDTILVPFAPVVARERKPVPTKPVLEAERDPMPARVAVTGAVSRPMSFLYQPALGVDDYLRLAGGATNVGDVTRVRVLRRDGSFAERGDALEAGDIIVVPTTRPETTAESVDEDSELRKAEKEAARQAISENDQILQRFGMSYFDGSRRYIRNIEEQVNRPRTATAATSTEDASATAMEPTNRALPVPSAIVKDAISGFVGPTDLLNANALISIPHNQRIEPGNILFVTSWSETSGQPPSTVTVTVEPDGNAVVPPHGRLTVVGMTLDQFESAVRDFMARTTFSDLKVVATFDRLRTIQVSVVGNAHRPGNYATSAATSLFNALYLSGGPSESGSLRNITLKRGDKTIPVDFYRYLLNGDADQDVTLEGGDVIWIGPARRQVTATGEFLRPAIYELTEREGFAELVSMALGIRPSGFAKTVQIESVEGHTARVIRTLDAAGSVADAPPLLDGDRVTVYPVLSEPVNTVQAKGYIKQPRLYEYRDGMRVADLARMAGGLRDGAFAERADLYRRNDDGETTTLIPVRLGAALDGDADANIPLIARDRLVIYSESEVDWTPPRIVSAQGAIVRAGNYPRADGMRVSDLLLVAGGVQPNGYAEHGLLLRVDARNRLARSVRVNLASLEGDANPILQDGDVLLVLTHEEARWEPAREVRITGAVQTPGLVPFTDGMRVSDALFRAGGVAPDHADVALLLRKDPERWDRVSQSVVVNLKSALSGDRDADPVVQPEDEIIVYRVPETRWEPEQKVTVVGAVQRGDTYERTDGMRISDLLFRAGGVMPNALLTRADLYRYETDYEQQTTVPVDLERVLRGDAEADIPLHDGDLLRVSTVREALYVPDDIVTIYGAVQRPDTYVYTKSMRLLDLIHLAGGTVPGASPKIEIARARQQDDTSLISVDCAALLAGDESQNVALTPGDVVSVARSSLFHDAPRLVSIEGAVLYPGVYAIRTSERISDLVKRAGGVAPNGYEAGAVLTREDDRIVSKLQRQSLDELWEIIDETNELEHERALARARVEAQREGATLDPLTDSISSITEPLAGALGASGLAAAATPDSGNETTTDPAKRTDTTKTATTALEESAVAGGPSTTEIARARTVELVTPARTIENLVPSNRVVIDLPAILAKRHGTEDLLMAPGDRLFIPEKTTTVTVAGAVARPGTFTFASKLKLDNYVAFAGGATNDADMKRVYVLRANGLAFSKKEIERIAPGDVVVVPTRVMSERFANRWDRVVNVLRFAITTAATTALLIAIVNRN